MSNKNPVWPCCQAGLNSEDFESLTVANIQNKHGSPSLEVLS